MLNKIVDKGQVFFKLALLAFVFQFSTGMKVILCIIIMNAALRVH